VVWEIEMPSSVHHGYAVTAEFEEKEYLFPPYSVFIVKSAKWTSKMENVVVLEAVFDNKEHPEDLPLCAWH